MPLPKLVNLFSLVKSSSLCFNLIFLESFDEKHLTPLLIGEGSTLRFFVLYYKLEIFWKVFFICILKISLKILWRFKKIFAFLQQFSHTNQLVFFKSTIFKKSSFSKLMLDKKNWHHVLKPNCSVKLWSLCSWYKWKLGEIVILTPSYLTSTLPLWQNYKVCT